MATDSGWGQDPGGPAATYPDTGWGETTPSGPAAGWEVADQRSYQPPAPAPVTGLWVAFGAAATAVVIGLGLTFLVERPTTLTAAIAVVAWLLAGIVPVLAVASYQRIDLRRAASIYYRPNPTASPLRSTVLVLGVIGVVLNALHFSEWLARL